MTVTIVDYGMGNLASVFRCCEAAGATPQLSSQAEVVASSSRLILPGVGSFKEAMTNLHRLGLVEAIRASTSRGATLLGICLGMQLLADSGCEGSSSPQPGLGLIEGSVERLEPLELERVPHVGWNEVHHQKAHPILNGIDSGRDFYFVHSYHFKACSPEHVLSSTPYCGGFNSIVVHNNVVGTQFHPEKSSKVGGLLVKNFLEWQS